MQFKKILTEILTEKGIKKLRSLHSEFIKFDLINQLEKKESIHDFLL